MTRQVVVIITGRHRPHELALLGVSAVLGAAFLLEAPPPTSVASQMPHGYVVAWAAGLMVSGTVGLIGCLVSLGPRRGLLLEAGGMLIQAGALLIVLAAVFAFAGSRGLFSGGFVGAWIAANLVRAWQIRRDLRQLRDVR